MKRCSVVLSLIAVLLLLLLAGCFGAGSKTEMKPSALKGEICQAVGEVLSQYELKNEAELKALQGEKKTLQEQVTTLKGEKKTLQEQVTGLNAQVTALGGDKKTLQDQVTGLNAQVTALGGDKKTLQDQVTGLNGQIASLQKQMTEFVRPDDVAKSEMVSWTDDEAKALMRLLYPGNDKYRDPAFDTVLVRPLSWYENLLPIPMKEAQNEWPGKWVAWFSARYPEIATGYVWTWYKGEWQNVKMVPAHVNYRINLYYVVDGKLVGAGSADDAITSYVLAANLLE